MDHIKQARDLKDFLSFKSRSMLSAPGVPQAKGKQLNRFNEPLVIAIQRFALVVDFSRMSKLTSEDC